MDEILSIVSMLQVDGVFVKPSSGKEKMSARVVRRNHFEVILQFNVYLHCLGRNREFNRDIECLVHFKN